MTVVDASVQVALSSSVDPHHAVAMAWYESALLAGDELTAPWIIVAEVAAALSRGLDHPALAHEAVRRLVDGGPIRLVAVDQALARRAAGLAADQRLRGCDALYVALALADEAPLATLDRQQAERAATVVAVVRPGHV